MSEPKRRSPRGASSQRRPAGGPPPRRERRALSQIEGPVETRGDEGAAAILASAWEAAKAAPADELTHGFHAYPARMHPQMARHLIAELSQPRGRILDPFSGSGTVLIEALAAGRLAEGVDVNPVALRVAWARTRLWAPQVLDALLKEAEAAGEDAFRAARQRAPVSLSPAALDERPWYPPHVLLELQGLWDRIHRVEDGELQEMLRIVFSSLLVKISYQASETDPSRVERRIGRGTASRLFQEKARLLVAGLRALAKAAPAELPPARLHLGDARRLADIPDASVDLIVTSPPYPGVYDYVAHQARRFPWLGGDARLAADNEIGTRSRREDDDGEVDGLSEWRKDERRFLRQMARVLRPGAVACLVMGDSALDGRRYLADGSIFESARASGLVPVAIASQARPTPHPELARAFRYEPRREHVMMLTTPEERR